MWNPVAHTTEAWQAQITDWGKLAVIVFYSYLWLGILSSIISVVWPSSQGIDCYLVHFDYPAQQVVSSLVRVENLLLVVFYMFLGMNKTHLCNVTILACVMILIFGMSQPAMVYVDRDCWNGVKTSFRVFTFIPLLIWFLVLMEYFARHRRGSQGESQPLV